MNMKTKDSNEDARAVGYEMPKIHSLWRALEQGLFPFMMNEVAERKRPEMGMKPMAT